jgi:uncharacterized protein involved in exopolysaccharide biosynthesis
MTDLRAPSTASTSIRFSDFVLPLWQRRRGIILFVASWALIAVAAALLWPKSYRATATLLPPERRMDNPLFVPGSVEGLGAGLRGITLRHVATPTDVFVAILRSRTVLDSLVERHHLREEYKVKSLEKAAKKLAKNMNVKTTQDGMITIGMVASSAAKAADLANGSIEQLDLVNRNLATQEAAAIRGFIEKELDESRLRLTAAEDTMRAFQEKYGAVEVTEQARAVITAAAQIRAKILTAEVELGVLRRTRDESHPDVQNARAVLNELRARLQEIEGEAPVEAKPSDAPGTKTGDTGKAKAPPRDVFPPLSRVPALGFQYGRLLREVKTEEAVVALLTEQYHWARIEEKRSLPTVRVLDRAVPPERRYRPRRTLMVASIVAAALALAVMAAYALEIADRIRRQPERYATLHNLARDFRRGLRT